MVGCLFGTKDRLAKSAFMSHFECITVLAGRQMINVPNRQQLPLKDVVRNVLEESRMVLPGIQALFGFQLVAVFNTTFREIPIGDRYLHLFALMLTIVAIACLMAPAAYHRQVERYSVSHAFVDYASFMLCIGMAPLLLSISLDTYVVCNVITHAPWAAGCAGVVAFLLLTALWYVVPCPSRARRD